jgi:hypothetical protein
VFHFEWIADFECRLVFFAAGPKHVVASSEGSSSGRIDNFLGPYERLRGRQNLGRISREIMGHSENKPDSGDDCQGREFLQLE